MTAPGHQDGVQPDARGKVFFSYARSDAAFVLKIASALRADGVALWVDQLDIPKGARWDESVEGALKGCSCLVVVLSPASVGSFNVLDEVYYTLGEQKRVVPVLLHACDIPFRLRRFQYIDFTAGYEQGYAELRATLLGPSAPRPPPAAAPLGATAGAEIPVFADPGSGRERSPRGSMLRHVALGGALMFFGLLIVGLVSDSGQVEAPAETAHQESPGEAPAAGTSHAGSVQAPSGAGGAAAAPPEPPPAVPADSGAMPVDTGEPPATQVLEDPVVPVEPAPPPPGPAPELIAPADIPDFVERFIVAHNNRDVGQILALYDDKVDYLGRGHGAQVVLKHLHSMHSTWTDMLFRRDSKIEYELAEDGQVVYIAFTVDFVGSNAETSQQLRVRELMELRMVDGVMKITAERRPLDPGPAPPAGG